MRVSVLSPKSYYGDFFLVFLCITVHYSITVLSHILVFKVFCCKSGLQPCCTELTKSCDLSAGSGRVSTWMGDWLGFLLWSNSTDHCTTYNLTEDLKCDGWKWLPASEWWIGDCIGISPTHSPLLQKLLIQIDASPMRLKFTLYVSEYNMWCVDTPFLLIKNEALVLQHNDVASVKVHSLSVVFKLKIHYCNRVTCFHIS